MYSKVNSLVDYSCIKQTPGLTVLVTVITCIYGTPLTITGLRLPSQLQGVTALWPVPDYTAC